MSSLMAVAAPRLAVPKRVVPAAVAGASLVEGLCLGGVRVAWLSPRQGVKLTKNPDDRLTGAKLGRKGGG